MDTNDKPVGGLTIRQIEQSRQEMHERVDREYDLLVHRILTEGRQLQLTDNEVFLSLASDPARFKGMKPTAILFPDDRTAAETKWRMVASEILRDCNREPAMHERLMQLRGCVFGRNRCVLNSSGRNMDVPLQIENDLYFEGKFDTEFLLRMLRDNILDVVGYDYSRIGIAVYEPKLEMSVNQNSMDTMQEQL